MSNEREWTTIRVHAKSRKKIEQLMDRVRRHGWEKYFGLCEGASEPITLGSVLDAVLDRALKKDE